MKSTAVALLAIVTLTGCAAAVQQQKQQQAELYRTIPFCYSDSECKARWEAAQRWLAMNLALKIQTANDVVINTYGPGPNGTDLAAQVVREPVGPGTTRIIIKVWCNNMFGCFPNPTQAMLAFNSYVSAAPIPENTQASPPP